MARAQSKILSSTEKKEVVAELRTAAAEIRSEIRMFKTDRVTMNRELRVVSKKLKDIDKFILREQKELDKVTAKIAAARAS